MLLSSHSWLYLRINEVVDSLPNLLDGVELAVEELEIALVRLAIHILHHLVEHLVEVDHALLVARVTPFLPEEVHAQHEDHLIAAYEVRGPERVRQLFEHFFNALTGNECARVRSGILGPDCVEDLEIVLEAVEGVVLRQVVGLKLLQDHEDKEVEDYQSAEDYERQEVSRAVGHSTALRDPVLADSSVHCVVHYDMPVLAGGDSEECEHREAEVAEVVVVGDGLSAYDVAEEENAENSVDEEENEEEEEDMHEGIHGENDSLEEQLQASETVDESEKTSDSEHSEDTSELRAYS